MNTINRKVKYCAALIGGLVVLMSTCVNSYAAVKTVHKVMKVSGKPTAPIEISYTAPASAAIGTSVNVVVTIKALSDVSDLGLKVTANEGLSLNAGELVKNYGAQRRDAIFSETVAATPSAEGILYLNVFASGSFQGKTMIRVGAVPISVGTSPEKKLKKSGTIEKDSTGQSVIVMPADESGK